MRISLPVWMLLGIALAICAQAMGQRVQFPSTTGGLRPIAPGQPSTSGAPVMIPLNPSTQAGIYPSTGFGSPTFDPYAATATLPTGPVIVPSGMLPSGGFAGANPYGTPYPTYNGPNPQLPGSGQSAIIGTFPNTGSTYSAPGVYPNSSPSALFPSSTYGSAQYGNAPSTGSLFGGFFQNLFGSNAGFGGSYGAPTLPQPNYNLPNIGGGFGAWNPQGKFSTGTDHATVHTPVPRATLPTRVGKWQ
ncbi:MAG: hypothetical protein R3C53_03250 [Pirellulaceae bacterium]